jgi:hypothetical protein
MQYVSYARSRAATNKEEVKAIRRQFSAIRTHARLHKWLCVGGAIDQGSSASNMKRPGLQELIALCRSRPVDAVVVQRLDRLVRNSGDYAALSTKLKKTNTEIISLADDTLAYLPATVAYTRAPGTAKSSSLRRQNNSISRYSDRTGVQVNAWHKDRSTGSKRNSTKK